MGLRAKIALFFVGIAISAGFFPISAKADPHELTHATLARINATADQISEAINTQRQLFGDGGPSQLINRYMAEKRAEFAQQVKDKAAGINSTLKNLSENEFAKTPVHYERQGEYVLTKGRRQLLGGLAVIGVTIFNGYMTEPIMDLVGGPITLTSLFAAQITPLLYIFNVHKDEDRRDNENSKREVRAKAQLQKKISAAALDAFYARLVENGIDVPKKNREAWLLSRFDGGAIPHWETLSSAEKINLAREYQDFLTHFADAVAIAKPGAGKVIRNAAAQIGLSTEKVRFWSSASYRAICENITKAVETVVELDHQYGILQDPKYFDVLHPRNRVAVEYPEIFEAKTREKILSSNLTLPPEFQAHAESIARLNGVISLQVSKSARDVAEIKYAWTVDFPRRPDLAPIEFQVYLSDDVKFTFSEARSLVLAQQESMSFSSRFRDALTAVQFGDAIQERIEVMFPAEECKHAFSSQAATLKKVFEDVSAAAL